MTFTQALNRLKFFEEEIPSLHPKVGSDYRGRSIDAESVLGYLRAERYRFAEIASFLPAPKTVDARLLDVGIAYGFLPALLKAESGWKCEGLEIEENIQVYCPFAKAHGIPIHAGQLGVKPLPFADGSFEGIIFSEVLEHLRLSPKIVFRELHRILAPGGWMIVTTPNMARLNNILKLMMGRNVQEKFPDNVESENITDALTHIREYTMSEVTELLEKNGFVIQKTHFSRCMEMERVQRWLTCFIPPLRGNLMVLAKKV